LRPGEEPEGKAGEGPGEKAGESPGGKPGEKPEDRLGEKPPRKDALGIRPRKGDLGPAAKGEEGQRIKWSAFPVPGPLTKPGPGETVYDGPPDQAMLEAEALLAEIIRRLGLKAEIRATRIGPRIVLELESLDNYLLIGRKGASLNALELVINRVARQRRREAEGLSPEPAPAPSPELTACRRHLLEAAKDETGAEAEAEGEGEGLKCDEKPDDGLDENPQIVVDAENYRARRYQGILEKAAFMADKALKTNKPQVMTQLSSPERRLVHLAIESVPGLTTRSYGFGLVRNLTILPKKNRPVGPAPKRGARNFERG
jgi:predicted RNA-binding protein Jag